MKIADVLCELGLKAADAAAELAEGMPGLHAVACGRIVVYAILSSEATPDIASVTAAYDEIWVRKPEDAVFLRRYFLGKTKLYAEDESGDAPVWLRRSGEGYCLRKSTQIDKSTYVNGRPDAVVVGAGLAGAMTAWELSRRGARVTVIDAGCVPGSAASALYAGLSLACGLAAA